MTVSIVCQCLIRYTVYHGGTIDPYFQCDHLTIKVTLVQIHPTI